MGCKSFRKKGRIVRDKKVITRGSLNNYEELLPNDLIIEILSILPIKCIARYKCVCRSWRRIIEDRRFIEKIMYRKKHVKALYEKPFGFLFDIDGLILEKCNGTGSLIRNHMSTQVLELPDLEESHNIITSSMGYASSTNEYKVLHLYWKDFRVIGMKILTAGVDETWRPVQTPYTMDTSKNDETIYYTLDGIFYVMMYGRSFETDDQTNKIIGFKFDDESFIEFSMPEGLKLLPGDSLPWALRWDNKLAVGCMFENQCHIWVLLENNYKKPKWDERRLTCSYPRFHSVKDGFQKDVFEKDVFVRSVAGDSAWICKKGGSIDDIMDIKSGKIYGLGYSNFMVLRPNLVSFRGMKTRADQ